MTASLHANRATEFSAIAITARTHELRYTHSHMLASEHRWRSSLNHLAKIAPSQTKGAFSKVYVTKTVLRGLDRSPCVKFIDIGTHDAAQRASKSTMGLPRWFLA
jgi:hypothetical protein